MASKAVESPSAYEASIPVIVLGGDDVKTEDGDLAQGTLLGYTTVRLLGYTTTIQMYSFDVYNNDSNVLF